MKKIVSILAVMLMLAGCLYSAMAFSETTDMLAWTVVFKNGTQENGSGIDENGQAVMVTEEATESQTAETEGVELAETEAVTEEETVEETLTETETSEEEMLTEVETSGEEGTEETETEIIVTPFEQPKTMYATIALNVRRGPSTKYEVVSHLAMAQAVEVTGQADTGWYQFMMDGAMAYASNSYLTETKVEVPAPAPAPVADPAAQTPAPAQAATAAPAGVIMVGDSRCVQMQAAVGGGGCSWICENSKEYKWFSQTAIPKFDQYVGNGTKVVINMGVNDPEHYKDYVALINAKAAEWAGRGARTYLVSVNPVWENPYVTQEQVDTFNANVPGMLVGVTWIDTSSWLNANGYRLLDGLHYDDPTYVNIFNLIMGSL